MTADHRKIYGRGFHDGYESVFNERWVRARSPEDLRRGDQVRLLTQFVTGRKRRESFRIMDIEFNTGLVTLASKAGETAPYFAMAHELAYKIGPLDDRG